MDHEKKGRSPLIQACFFDIGGVLIDFDPEVMLQNLSTVTGLQKTEILALDEKHQLMERLETGKMTFLDFQKILTKEKNISSEELATAINSSFKEKKEVHQIVLRLKELQIPLFTLSNTSKVHFEHLQENCSIFSAFDDHVLSYEIGYRKPHLEIYSSALQKANHQKCLYIDDIKEFCTAGQNLGMEVHHFQNAVQLHSHLIDLGVFQ